MKLSIAAMTLATLLPFATLLPAAAQGPAPSGSGLPGTAGYRPPGARPPAARPPGPPGAGYRLPGTAGAGIPPGFRGPPPGVPRAGFAGPGPGVGVPGTAGYRGPIGGPGYRGPVGVPGTAGYRGPVGVTGYRRPLGVTGFRGRNVTFVRGPYRAYRGGYAVPLVGLGVLTGIYLGSRYYAPYAYVDGVDGPACAGPTDDGLCELRLTEVPFEGGGAGLQCVAYCP